MVLARVRLELQGCGIALLLLACGGRSSNLAVSGNDPTSTATAGESGGGLTSATGGAVERAPHAGGAATGGTITSGTAGSGAGGEAPAGTGGDLAEGAAGCTTAACELSAQPSPLWVTSLKGYGRGPASIRFSASDNLVRVGTGELDYAVTVLDRVTGEITADPQVDKGLVAEDASGRRVARNVGTECVVTQDGTETFRLPNNANDKMRFSPDGTAISYYSCVSEQDGVIQLDVYDTESGDVLASAKTSLPCVYGDLNLLVDASHRRTLFAHPARSELFVFDWDSETIATQTIHASAAVSVTPPRNHEGTILNIKLSPNAQQLVSVGAADGLAWLNPDTLAVEGRVPDVPFFNVYDNCYCTYLSESPVAWSPTGDIYATGYAGGGIALRDPASQKLLAVLEPPTDHAVIVRAASSDFGPVLIEFSPDMRELVALYPSVAVSYSLTRE